VAGSLIDVDDDEEDEDVEEEEEEDVLELLLVAAWRCSAFWEALLVEVVEVVGVVAVVEPSLVGPSVDLEYPEGGATLL
jgi:hypothetical protein